MLNTANKDNRKYERIAQALPVRMRFSDRLDSLWQEAQTLNISEGGMFVSKELSPESIGNIVHLEILLDKDGQTVKIICEVAWIKRDNGSAIGIGLKIIQIEGGNKETFITYIHRKIPSSLKKKTCKIKFLKEPLFKLSDKEKNCFQILDYIRRFGPVSKADISREINLNAVSVGKFIDEFLKSGIIYDCGFGTSSGGRPAQLFKLDKDFGLTLSIEVNIRQKYIYVLVTNMDFEIIMEGKTNIENQPNPKNVLCKVISDMLSKLGDKANQVLGIGIGFDEKISDDEVEDSIVKAFLLPVVIEEGFHLESFAQSWMTRELSRSSILYIHSKHALSLILEGDIYKPEKEIEGKAELSLMNLEEKALTLIEFLGPDIVYIAKRIEKETPDLRKSLTNRLKMASIKEAQGIKVLVSDMDEAKVVALGAASLVMKEIFIGICG